MASSLRPLTTIEVLDAAVLAIRHNGMALYACSAVGTVPLALLLIGYFLWLGRLVEGTEGSVFYTGTGVWAFAMALAWGVNSIARGAVVALVLGDAQDQPITPATAWRRARKHAAGSAFVGLFSFAAAWLASGCLFVPGVMLALAWWVARPVLLVEERPFAAVLRRSWRLTDGHRGKSFGLWLLFVALWLAGALNLHLLGEFLTGNAAGLLGIDTSGVQQSLKLQNQAYTTFLLAVTFVLLDPLKAAADALYYLDLRIRREGADLQDRLRALRAGASAALFLLVFLPALPARSGTVDDYRAKVRSLRSQVEAARSPEQIERIRVGEARSQLVQMPNGQKITVENEWLNRDMARWREIKDKEALLRRLEVLERSLGGVASAAPSTAPVLTPAPAPDVDTRQALRKILQEPEFQPLAERAELRDLIKGIDLSKTGNWWSSFWDWIRKTLFKPPQPKIEPPSIQPPKIDILQWVVWVLLAGVVLFLLALLVRWFVERPMRGGATPATVASEAPPLEASATENALDHSVDEWELFAQQWLGRGDVRQAIRALYLATLVHLHRERRIDYNRAFTNWVYVRQFRGETDHKGVLRKLTQTFDEVWYGERQCGEEHYRAFEQGARALGTPAPVGR